MNIVNVINMKSVLSASFVVVFRTISALTKCFKNHKKILSKGIMNEKIWYLSLMSKITMHWLTGSGFLVFGATFINHICGWKLLVSYIPGNCLAKIEYMSSTRRGEKMSEMRWEKNEKKNNAK